MDFVRNRFIFWLMFALVIVGLQVTWVNMNVGTPEKERVASKQLEQSLQIINNYYYYYNKNNFAVIDKYLLYYPAGVDATTLKRARLAAFREYRNSYGLYKGPMYPYTFEFLKICGENFRPLAKSFLKRHKLEEYDKDPQNLLNTFCIDSEAKPKKMFVNFSSSYTKKLDKGSSFTLVFYKDEKNADKTVVKILKFPVNKETLPKENPILSL